MEAIDFSQIQKGTDSLKTFADIDSIHSVKLIETLQEQFAQFRFFENGFLISQLISVETGSLPPFVFFRYWELLQFYQDFPYFIKPHHQ